MPFDKRKKLPLAEIVTPGRVCWLCEHVRFTTGDRGYSEYTPGYDFSFECGKGYWEFDNYDDGLKEFRAQLTAAERCADFVRRSDD